MPIKMIVSLLMMAGTAHTAQAQQPAPQVSAAETNQALTSATAAVGGAPAAGQEPNIPGAQTAEAAPAFLTPFEYDARGRRDPFMPPLDEKPVEQGVVHGPFLPLQKFDLTQIKLSAIIWDVSHPKAMITDPDGKVYIVGPNTKIGKNNGYIAVIREGEMIVVETTEENGRLLSATRILRLAPPGVTK